jgi:hypothetical protein
MMHSSGKWFLPPCIQPVDGRQSRIVLCAAGASIYEILRFDLQSYAVG